MYFYRNNFPYAILVITLDTKFMDFSNDRWRSEIERERLPDRFSEKFNEIYVYREEEEKRKNKKEKAEDSKLLFIVRFLRKASQ